MSEIDSIRRKIKWMERLGGGYFGLLMVEKRWFRWGFFFFVLLALTAPFFFLKIWRVTPEGFKPEIKISCLDWLQAKSLRRSAEHLSEAGNYEAASYAWRAAMANNITDLSVHRAAMRSLVAAGEVDPKIFDRMAISTYWLPVLGQTNRQDLGLLARVFYSQRIYEQALAVLIKDKANLDATEQAIFAKSLFQTGQVGEFNEYLSGITANPDPELPLYQAAFKLGWGNRNEREGARDTFTKATNDVPHRVLATQLYLLASFHREDDVSCRNCLAQLESWQKDKLFDHILYWRLLLKTGRKSEAAPLVEHNKLPPRSPADLMQITDICWEFGLTKQAIEIFHDYGPQFSYMPEVWINHANLLIQGGLWNELRSLALEVRDNRQMQAILRSHSHFLEGLADYSQNRPDSARAAFREAANGAIGLPGVALHDATRMVQLGYEEEAGTILRRLPELARDKPEFWQAYFQAAYDIRAGDLMREAAAKCKELQPDNPTFLNNYAAALLVNRDQVAEALRYTLRLNAMAPNSLVTKFNHATALLLNERTDEAAALFKAIDTRPLNQRQMTYYNLAWFEIFYNQKKFDEAWQALDGVETKYLFPAQFKWFEQAKLSLPARRAKPTASAQ